MPGLAVRDDVTPFVCHLKIGQNSAPKIKHRRRPHAFIAVSTKYGNKPFASTKPNAGAIALLWRLCTSPATLSNESGEKANPGRRLTLCRQDTVTGQQSYPFTEIGWLCIQITRFLKNVVDGLRIRDP